MQSFKVTGTPGEPVRLDTLKPGDWFYYTHDENGDSPQQRFSRAGDVVIIQTLGLDPSWDSLEELVHPLTRHELPDGTVEFRHVEPEQKPDCADCSGVGRDNVPYGEKCETCNGTGVKPELAQTCLERLPEAVRDELMPRGCTDMEQAYRLSERRARVILEHMTPKGGAQ